MKSLFVVSSVHGQGRWELSVGSTHWQFLGHPLMCAEVQNLAEPRAFNLVARLVALVSAHGLNVSFHVLLLFFWV